MNKQIINGCAISVLPSKYDAIIDKQTVDTTTTSTVNDNHTKDIVNKNNFSNKNIINATTSSVSDKNTTQFESINKYIPAPQPTDSTSSINRIPKTSTSVLGFKPRKLR